MSVSATSSKHNDNVIVSVIREDSKSPTTKPNTTHTRRTRSASWSGKACNGLSFDIRNGFYGAFLRKVKHQVALNEPLQVAAYCNRPNMVKVLVQHGAKVNFSNLLHGSRTPICIASRHGDTDTVQMLCDLHADVNKADKDGCTPMLWAAAGKHTKTIQILAKHNADVNKSSKHGQTPVMLAAEQGSTDIVRMFAKLRADLNKPDNLGRTPVWLACSKGNTDALRVLAEYKADLLKGNKLQQTPLHVAAYMNQLQCLKYLIEQCHIQIDDMAIPYANSGVADHTIINYLDQMKQEQLVEQVLALSVLPRCA